MALKVIGGRARIESEFEKRRVSFICLAPNSVQMISGMMMVKRKERPGMPPVFFGPIRAAWENVRAAHPDVTADLNMIGVLIATPEGNFRGQIDWLQDSHPPVTIEHDPDEKKPVIQMQ